MGVILYSDHKEKVRKLNKKFLWANILWALVVVLTFSVPHGFKLQRDSAVEAYQDAKTQCEQLEARRELLSILRTRSLSIAQALDIVDIVLTQEVIPVPMVLAVMAQESEFNPWAKSSKDARSWMQVVPATYRIYANPLLKMNIHASDPILTTRAGILFLGDMKKTFKNWKVALRAYYAGPTQANNRNYDWYTRAVLAKAVKYGMKL